MLSSSKFLAPPRTKVRPMSGTEAGLYYQSKAVACKAGADIIMFPIPPDPPRRGGSEFKDYFQSIPGLYPKLIRPAGGFRASPQGGLLKLPAGGNKTSCNSEIPPRGG